jgi:hypothetical protein
VMMLALQNLPTPPARRQRPRNIQLFLIIIIEHALAAYSVNLATFQREVGEKFKRNRKERSIRSEKGVAVPDKVKGSVIDPSIIDHCLDLVPTIYSLIAQPRAFDPR